MNRDQNGKSGDDPKIFDRGNECMKWNEMI